jgi:hypothetical protein
MENLNMTQQYPAWQEVIRTAQAEQIVRDKEAAEKLLQKQAEKRLQEAKFLGSVLFDLGIDVNPTSDFYVLEPYRFSTRLINSSDFGTLKEYRLFVHINQELEAYMQEWVDEETAPSPVYAYAQFVYPIHPSDLSSVRATFADAIDKVDRQWEARRAAFESGELYAPRPQAAQETQDPEPAAPPTPAETLVQAINAYLDEYFNSR